MNDWHCPYDQKPLSPLSCQRYRAAKPVVGVTDHFSICRECTVELPDEPEIEAVPPSEALESILASETMRNTLKPEKPVKRQNTAPGKGIKMESKKTGICEICHEEKLLHARDQCRDCYNSLRGKVTVELNFRSRPKLLAKIKELAENEEWTVADQIYFMLRRQVEADSK